MAYQALLTLEDCNMLEPRLRRRNAWIGVAMACVLGSTLGCNDSSSEDNDAKDTQSMSGSSSASAGDTAQAGGSSASSALMGTGEMCQSYTEAADGMCASWYCGVTESQLMDAVDPNAKCGGDVALLCAGSVTAKVGICARRLKAENFSATNEELRPLVRDCVYEDPEVKAAVPADCLDCTIDAAACAADNCLTQCLAGDSPMCDDCRRESHCDQSVFSCGGLPAPIM